MVETDVELQEQLLLDPEKHKQIIHALLQQISKLNQRLLLLKVDGERLVEKEQIIQTLSAQIVEQVIHIQQLEVRTTDQAIHIQQLETRTTNLEQQLVSKEGQLRNLEQRLTAIEHTKVWQLALKWYGFKRSLFHPKNS